MTAATTHPFDLHDRWVLHPSVAVRPEPFGALLYHFGTRRLTFLKDRTLLAVVTSLDGRTAREACEAAGVGADDVPRFAAALARLAATGMLARPGEAS